MHTTETAAPGALVNPVTGTPFTTTRGRGLSALAGTVIGYRKNGMPIRLQAGGSQPVGGEGAPAGADAGGTGQAPASSGSTTSSGMEITVTEVGSTPPVDGLRTSGTAVTPPATPTPAPPATVTPPVGQPDQSAAGIEGLPEWAQKELRDARKGEAAKRDAAKRATEAQAAAEKRHEDLLGNIAKVLGLAPSQEEVDPAKLTADLADAQRVARENRVELAVYREAAKHGGDPDALLDSRSFAAKALALDPKADDFQDKLTAVIAKAVEDNPKLAVRVPETTTPPPAGGGVAPGAGPSGGSFAGGPGAPGSAESLTVDDFISRRKKRA